MKYTTQDIIDIFQSPDLIKFASQVVKSTQKDIIAKLDNSLNDYRRNISHNWESYPHLLKTTLSLIDDREIIRFRLVWYCNELTVYEVFQPINQKVGSQILEMIPIDPNHIVIEWCRTYFDDGKDAFELLIWTLIAEQKVKRNDQFFQFVSENYRHYAYTQFDECYISNNEEGKSIRDLWKFWDYFSKKNGNKIMISGKASCNYYRQRDYEVDYDGSFDLTTGEIILDNYDFGSHDYK